jgi:RNA 3'-terminal phosphate cyclase-like protein
VDTLRTVTLPLLRKFGVDAGLEMRVVKRGAAPGGGGEVALRVRAAAVVVPARLWCWCWPGCTWERGWGQ